MRLILTFLSAFLVLNIWAAGAHATQIFNFCEDAQSTADSMACIKKRHDNAQKHLNTTFEKIIKTQGENKDNIQALNDAQTNWLSYRDQECKWATQQVENESLHRIEELACLTTLTQQRIRILEETLSRQQAENVKEYGTFPRWMNVVAKNYPSIFWRYGDQLDVDLDCDKQNEKIMAGQKSRTRTYGLPKTSPTPYRPF